MEQNVKKCCNCGLELPKTNEFFYSKIVKQKLADGSVSTYHSFRSECKRCHNNKNENRRVRKRCVHMNCDVSDYRDNWKKQYSNTRTKNPELSYLTVGQQGLIRKKIADGYEYTTYEQYKTDCRKNVSQGKRKYDYEDCDFISRTDKNRIGINNLTDGYIALTLKNRVDDIPKEIIETKRLVLKLKRELKMTNYGNKKRS